MIRVHPYPEIYVGNDEDAKELLSSKNLDDYFILHAAKEPYHREFVGYTGRAADKNHPEYLFSRRGNRLALNIVDAPKGIFFSMPVICAGLNFINEAVIADKKIFIHCNKGESRSTGITILYLAKRLYQSDVTLDRAIERFKQDYPNIKLGQGMFEHLTDYWDKYNLNWEQGNPCPWCGYDDELIYGGKHDVTACPNCMKTLFYED